MSPHSNPDQFGHTFGKVVVTIDTELGDCILYAPQSSRGPVKSVIKKARFHSIEEIEGAMQTQNWLSRKPNEHPHANDMARALKFAGQMLAKHQERQHG